MPIVVEMKQNAEILTIQLQDDNFCLWAIVQDNAKIISRTFEIIQTGEKMTEANRKYIGTFQDGWFVGHCFEILD